MVKKWHQKHSSKKLFLFLFVLFNELYSKVHVVFERVSFPEPAPRLKKWSSQAYIFPRNKLIQACFKVESYWSELFGTDLVISFPSSHHQRKNMQSGVDGA